uniref:Uncharacterized protein n=1 Tax=Manihot esculenta TaxID=3983 RepID=A0A2C9VCU3_MANES
MWLNRLLVEHQWLHEQNIKWISGFRSRKQQRLKHLSSENFVFVFVLIFFPNKNFGKGEV